MKVWNNQLGKKTKWKEGHSSTEIMDNVNVGDKVINGIGEVLICTMKLDLNEYHNFGEKSLRVYLHPTKKDGTLHKGRSSISYKNDGMGWEREYYY
jgi:hypothetical protein